MEFAGIGSIPIVSGIRYAAPSQVYVAMIETANNRLKQNPAWFGDVGMLIVDECHRGEHKKIYEYFPEAKIVGFTATPISSSKKDPLNNYFDDIVSTISIEKLIAQGALTPNRTYHIKNINRKALKVDSKGEFNTKMMGDAFSSGKHIQNTVDAYEKFAKGTKAIVFNCNIEHSQLVHEEFLSRGYPSRNFDSKKNKNIRPELMQWFKNTPGAILNNIDIFTTGVDETSIETIMMNRSTLSKTLWIQCGGRGSRLHPGKKFFTIIDMGGNAKAHCDWNYPHDWNYIFHNPDKPRESDGIVPQKECEGCEALIPAQARVCPFCGYIHERTVDYDSGIPEFELVTTNAHAINVQEVISLALGHNDYHALHNIKGRIVADARRRSDKITTEQVYSLLSAYHEKVQEWCRAKKKNFDQWHKDTTAKWFFAEINRQFGWEQPQLSLDIAI
jgi:superfamily II DNA or RNA helicase